ncbi:MAG: HlyD family secretion protein [Oscillospiraceae bacterium]|nr:HlyD family secretion protein [Oscillospiraceae bacterium]
MREESVRKRGWVKNATIIFLAALVVFLLFSNTIFNLGLPEVAVQHSGSGTITARIRASGTVSAIERYEVMTSQTWEVSEVRVRPGAEVQPGDILIVMAGEVSEELEAMRAELRQLERTLEELIIRTSLDTNYAAENRAINIARAELDEARAAVAAIPYIPGELTNAEATVNVLNAEVQARALAEQQARTLLNAITPPAEGQFSQEYETAKTNLANATAALELARLQLGFAEETLARVRLNRAEWEAASEIADGRQRSLDNLIFELSEMQRADGIQTALTEIEVRELNLDIETKREEISSLEGDGAVSELTSPVYGTIASVNITPGNQAQAETPLIVIDVIDRGFSLSIPVTVEQSMRVTVGDNAEVDRGWWGWGGEVTATLVGIRNDPENPVTGRRLEFILHGSDIESGEQLNITLNQRSENFDTVVPNAALRSDTNGDFVLTIMTRQSPLGTRFTATRVDVTILARDDTHTAVSGALSVWGESVITTSTAPVDPGMQIRLAANP